MALPNVMMLTQGDECGREPRILSRLVFSGATEKNSKFFISWSYVKAGV
jgi:hypothetical protein